MKPVEKPASPIKMLKQVNSHEGDGGYRSNTDTVFLLALSAGLCI